MKTVSYIFQSILAAILILTSAIMAINNMPNWGWVLIGGIIVLPGRYQNSE